MRQPRRLRVYTPHLHHLALADELRDGSVTVSHGGMPGFSARASHDVSARQGVPV